MPQLTTKAGPGPPLGRKRVLGRILAIGVAIAIALNLPFFLYDITRYLSHARAFHEIRLRMTREEVDRVLHEHGTRCAMIGSICLFSDFWREYSVNINPTSNQVTRKYFAFRRPKPTSTYLVLRLFSKVPRGSSKGSDVQAVPEP